jgi:hypothetical protein
MNYEQMHYEYINTNNPADMNWDDIATPIELLPVAQPIPITDDNGWLWYPDSNGNLYSLYFDNDGNECMIWRSDNADFYWQCAGVGYNCRDIGIEGRRGIFFQDILVGTMLMNNELTVNWLPETYIPTDDINNINNINNINDHIQINDNFIEVNDIDTDTDVSEEDDTNDE